MGEIIVSPITTETYDQWVADGKPLVLRWKGATLDVCRFLDPKRVQLSRTRLGANVSDETLPTWLGFLNDIGLHRATAHRWLAQYDAKNDKMLPPPEPHVSHNSGNNEWYTPEPILAAARAVMGKIDLDPASSEVANGAVEAGRFFTTEDDGLTQKWFGNVWMNPPYAQPLVNEFSKAITEKYQSGEIQQACVLVNNATETEWFQRMFRVASAACFLLHRVKFLDPDGNASGAPLQGQAVLYMGKDAVAFSREYGQYGTVVEVV